MKLIRLLIKLIIAGLQEFMIDINIAVKVYFESINNTEIMFYI